MDRIYQHLVSAHFADYKQMAILNGPRQVGKTTISEAIQLPQASNIYLNWDAKEDRKHILAGQQTLANTIGLEKLANLPVIVFDELHQYSKWKSFIKGFYDLYSDRSRIIVTGSQTLNVESKSGDSLMGRYFPFRIYPFSVAECVRTSIAKQAISPPKKIDHEEMDALWRFGGFPDPFLKQDQRFLNRWKTLTSQQLFRGDIRDLTRIQEIGQLELLAEILGHQAAQQVNYSKLAAKVNVDTKTIQKWINTLEQFYFCFRIRPWTKNIVRSLLKEPKLYLMDWSSIDDVGARAENFVACHLLKATHFWTDCGIGEYRLHYIRTKDKQEVDFLVTENDKPWFLVEVKYSNNQSVSENLHYFQQKTKAKHAFQVVFNMDYVDQDCFTRNTPVIVPASTFLSQLI